MGSDCLMVMGFSFGVMKTSGNWIEVMVTPHCKSTKCHASADFKRVHFMLCDFHLNLKKKRKTKSTNKTRCALTLPARYTSLPVPARAVPSPDRE